MIPSLLHFEKVCEQMPIRTKQPPIGKTCIYHEYIYMYLLWLYMQHIIIVAYVCMVYSSSDLQSFLSWIHSTTTILSSWLPGKRTGHEWLWLESHTAGNIVIQIQKHTLTWNDHEMYLGKLWSPIWIKGILGRISLATCTFWDELGWGQCKFDVFVQILMQVDTIFQSSQKGQRHDV